MDHGFWQQRWNENQIGFHQSDLNAHLLREWPQLGVPDEATVFVPLCGKSRDLLWLRKRGHHVVGVEWSPTAVEAFFEENGIAATRDTVRGIVRWRAEGLTVYCGDYFALDRDHLVGATAVFDRAALIALPPETRRAYAEHMLALTPPGTRMLLVTLQYADGALPGPPFSVPESDVRAYYGAAADVAALQEEPATGPRDIDVVQRVYRVVRGD